MISSELLTDLLSVTGEGPIEPLAQARLQALVDAVPVALMEFRLQGERLQLLAANAAGMDSAAVGKAVRTDLATYYLKNISELLGIVERSLYDSSC